MEQIAYLMQFELPLFVYIVVSISLATICILALRKLIKAKKIERIKHYTAPLSMYIFIACCLLSFIFCVIGIINLISRNPEVFATYPQAKSVLSTYEKPFEITFSAPVDFRFLQTNLSPVTQGHWELVKYAPFLPFGRTIRFHPLVSFLPGQRVLLYMSNIRSPFSRTFGGEFGLEFYTLPAGNIIQTLPGNSAVDVAPDQALKLKLDENDTAASIWSVSLMPETKHRVETNHTKTLTVLFDAPLHQATTYTMKIYRSLTTYVLASGLSDKAEQPELVKTITFETTKPPLITSFSPTSDSVTPLDHIQIVFQNPMQPESVASNLTIEPSIPGSLIWSKENTVATYNSQLLEKDTKYTVTLKKGAKSATNGMLESDITYTFKTVGVVDVQSATPQNGQNNVEPNKPIQLTFNQDVDHTSAESHFSIEPSVDGKISWDGRSMIFTPSSAFGYQSSYTTTLKPGIKSIWGIDSQASYQSSFTTAPQQLILDVPFYNQQEDFTCNIAAARMLLAYKSILIPEATLKAEVGSSGARGNGDPNKGHVANYGVYWDPLLTAVLKHRPARLIKNGTIQDITAEISKGNPVMIWGQNGWSDPHEISWDNPDGTHIYAINGMHSSVARGFVGPASNPTSIVINDPWRTPTTLSVEQFLKNWSYFRVALVVD